MTLASTLSLCALQCFVAAQCADDVYFPRYKNDDFATEIPFPVEPESQLPELNGSAYPPYRTVFLRGECSGTDRGNVIDIDKTCFSCFRIPTIIKTSAAGEGTLLAFAEARRSEQIGVFHQYVGSGMVGCPDIPDTRLVYKRSINGGKSWGPLSVFLEAPGRAEDGECQGQAAPVVDPVTKTIFVGFNRNGCNNRMSTSSIVHSTDDGVTWSTPVPLIVNGITVGVGDGPIMGPTKGLTIIQPGGGVRLMLPGEGSNGRYVRELSSLSIYSDDHGKTWNSNGTATLGEFDWTPCTPGTCGGSKYIVINREPTGTAASFSNDTVNWTPKRPTNADAPWSSHHAKAGVIAVPGGLVMSEQIMQCPAGVRTCGRKPSDVIGYGMALFVSRDGVTWKLLKKIWPYGGMYSTLIPLTVDKDGGALTYGVVYTGGTIGGAGVEVVNFQNFTFSPSDLDILDITGSAKVRV